MPATELHSSCRQGCAPGDRARLFTADEARAVRVGALDLARERVRRRGLISRWFRPRRNRLADPMLEALRTLVVAIGLARDDEALDAAWVVARDAGLRERQIAVVIARHRVERDPSSARWFAGVANALLFGRPALGG